MSFAGKAAFSHPSWILCLHLPWSLGNGTDRHVSVEAQAGAAPSSGYVQGFRNIIIRVTSYQSGEVCGEKVVNSNC